MKPQIMTRIFDPFYSTRKKSGGTGLGLSMTKGIVNLHGGGIYVESELGREQLLRCLFRAKNMSRSGSAIIYRIYREVA